MTGSKNTTPAAKTIRERINKLSETRRGFFLVIAGFGVIAFCFGMLTWNQIEAIRNDLPFGQTNGRILRYWFNVVFYGLMTLITGFWPVAIGGALIWRLLRRLAGKPLKE